MYIETIEFKRTKNSEWEDGFYVGDGENSDISVMLDINYKPVVGEIYDCCKHVRNYLTISIPNPYNS